MHHNGDMTVTSDNLKYAKAVTSVSGDLWIYAECDMPVLKTVWGNLRIDAECNLPALQTVDECLFIRAVCELSELQTVGTFLLIGANCNLTALQTVGGRLIIRTDCDLPALTVAHGVPGRLIATSTYGLWLGDNGLYYAGCHKGLTKDQAVNHWIDREDERALKFIGAILAN